MNRTSKDPHLENMVSSLEDLLRNFVSPEEFYHIYLRNLLASLPGNPEGVHLWSLQARDFVPLGGSDHGQILYDSNSFQRDFLLQCMREAVQSEKTILILPGGSNLSSRPLAITPLLYGGGLSRLQGAQICWWNEGGTLPESVDHVLNTFAPYCAQMIRTQKIESISQISEKLQQMTLFLTEIGNACDLDSLAVSVVNHARAITECDRCVLLVVGADSKLRLAAVSNVPLPDGRSAVSRTLLQLAENARKGLPAIYRKGSEKKEEKGDLSDYFFHSHMAEVMILPIQVAGKPPVGMLMLEFECQGSLDSAGQQTALALATQSAGALSSALHTEHYPLRGLLQRLVHWRQLHPDERRRHMLRRIWIPALIIILICIIPMRYEFAGDARLLPKKRVLVVSEIEGRISKVLSKDGDYVVAGQELVELDDSEQLKQCQIAAQEEARLQAETDRLMELNDRDAVQVTKLQLERTHRQRQHQEYNLGLTRVSSSIPGVVMTTDLQSRQGDAVSRGSQLAIVGDPNSWELEVGIPETNVAEMLMRLHSGKPAPVRYVLNALPHREFKAEVTREECIASSSNVVAGKNIFRVLVPLPEDPAYAALFRAGYTGRARIGIGYRPLVFIATHRFINWIRTHVLF
jgi:biotin carboxyl carrier protein